MITWKLNLTNFKGIQRLQAKQSLKMQLAEKQLIYLYCVTAVSPTLKEAVKLVSNLYFVYYVDIYAIVSKVAESEFGEESLKKNMADLEWVKANASTHEKIIEQVMAEANVIPFKFGILFRTDEGLKTMLEEYSEEFKAIFRKLENKEERGVKIYCDTEKLKASVINNESEILEIENKINSSPPGKAFFLEKKKAELLAQSANAIINEYSKESFELLKELSFEARINKLLPKEVTEREDDMVLNSAFLVSKDKVDDFINMVDTLKTHYENKSFFIDCTGPWPPYNFCDLSKQKVRNA